MGLYLREATAGDKDLLFGWVNDTLVRNNSFSTRPVTYEEHTVWYGDLLRSPDAKQYIYMEDDMPVGQARVKIRDDVAEIGYSICSEKRCMGYGTKLLGELARRVEMDFPGVRRLAGLVRPENTASQKAFANAGYELKYQAYERMLGAGQDHPAEAESSGGVFWIIKRGGEVKALHARQLFHSEIVLETIYRYSGRGKFRWAGRCPAVNVIRMK